MLLQTLQYLLETIRKEKSNEDVEDTQTCRGIINVFLDYVNKSAMTTGYEEPYRHKTVVLKLSKLKKKEYGVTKKDFDNITSQPIVPFITTDMTINGTKLKVDTQGFSECYNETEGSIV